MKIKRKSEQSKKQTKVFSPSLKSTNKPKEKLDKVTSSSFLQKQPPRLSPRRVASKLITPSPSSNNNSSANSSSTESKTLADESGGRRVSSRRRKPSWRINSIDGEQQADGLKVASKDQSKDQKTISRKSSSSSPQSDSKSIASKRKQDSITNRKPEDSFSTPRLTNGTPVSASLETTTSVNNSNINNNNDNNKYEATVITKSESPLLSTANDSSVVGNVEVIVLTEDEPSVVNGKSEDSTCSVVENNISCEEQQPKRLKLTNGQDEHHPINGNSNVVNGIAEDAQNEEIRAKESVVQVQTHSEDLLRKPSLDFCSTQNQIDTNFKSCCCDETVVGGKNLRISKESAELSALDEISDKDDFDTPVEPFCQAVDLVDSKRFGCVRPATQNLTLYRVSHRSPFRLLCLYHQKRLKLHQCCALCGHFCLQGPGVLLCTGNSPSKWSRSEKCFVRNFHSHLFHRECALEQIGKVLDAKTTEQNELISKYIVCPHCGASEPETSFNVISVRFQAAQSPVFIPDRPVIRKIAMVSVPKSVNIVPPGDNTLRYIEDSTAATLATAMEEAKMLLAESPNFANRGDNFLRALMDDNVAQVMACLLSGDVANTQFDSHRHQSALHLAVSNRNICLIHGLIVSGANPNVKDLDGMTPLMLAGKLNEATLAKYLIAAGAEKFERGFEGMNVVHLSAMAGNLLVLQSVLEDHPNLSRTVGDNGMTPLMVAAKYSRTEVVNYLATYWSSEINIRAHDINMNTALHWAAASGAVQAVSTLIQNGAEVNATNRSGQTPLHWAVSHCRDGCVLALLVNHANLSAVDVEGKTPLDLCKGDNDEDGLYPNETARARQTIKSCIMQTSALRSQLSMVAEHEENHHNYRVVSNDISCGKEPHRAIQCVNAVDEEGIPEDFTYITTMVFRNGSSLTPPIISSSKTLKCNCQSDNSTQKHIENVNKEASKHVSNNNVGVPFVCSKECLCLCSQNGLSYDARGRIVFNYVNATHLSVIQECNQLCKCDIRLCRNRVVQRGMTYELQVFRKHSKKWGVKTNVRIPRGSFVCTYTGEIVTSFQYSNSGGKDIDSYAFELYDHILLDARKFGNVSRFMNHSCSPNVVPIKTLIEHEDERFPHIAFFSIRDIEANEELCYDYGEKYWELNISKGSTCDCESDGCRYVVDGVTLGDEYA